MEKGGERLKKKILTTSIILIALGMLVAPVMARGPVTAEIKNDNPNVEIMYGNIDCYMVMQTLPSGVILMWGYFPNIPSVVHVKVKFATEFSNPELLDAGDNYMMWLMNQDYRRKWVHMNKGVYAPYPSGTGYLGLFALFGFPELDCPAEGVYIWGKEKLLS